MLRNERRMPKVEHRFLLDERGDRKMVIGGLDIVTVRKNKKLFQEGWQIESKRKERASRGF